MIRFVMLLVLAAVVVTVGAIAVAVWSTGDNARSGKLNGVQKVAYICLFAMMTGVATGWLGAE
ncbi:hypothetical protein Q4577_12000 [Marinovum sp. 2_MG-2023]|uniref:hypothetical protein n=1 Tax=Roseobacteraceae TaxID=2854170 RepID=UPI001FD1ED83|nr:MULTISPECIES: hypothetical protein [Roseobacteraceae]MCJ7873137.1 hypothetical protein [Phaeobacter sp. J2-8]MDO6730744.1 hypothetical protein [Marinovum sp. 2_MG-2023]MDO6780051.1 hypothetical protein [Marinovum sp. 1_MG-2023]